MHEVKFYKCNLCGKEYKWIDSNKQHMKKHEGHDDKIGLPTKVYTPGTGRTAVNEGNVVTIGEQKSVQVKTALHWKSWCLLKLKNLIER